MRFLLLPTSFLGAPLIGSTELSLVRKMMKMDG
jgi:hypothetical protein